jgi:hypothetical protein
VERVAEESEKVITKLGVKLILLIGGKGVSDLRGSGNPVATLELIRDNS